MAGFVAQTASLIGKELKVLARDRQALLLLFVMPAVFILFLSFALQNVFDEKVGASVPVVIECEDEGGPAVRVLERLRSRPEFRVVPRTEAIGNRELFDSGSAKAAISIPAGFSEDLEAFIESGGRRAFGPHRIVWDADPTLDATYRWFLKASIAMAVQGAILDSLADREEREAGEGAEPAGAMDEASVGGQREARGSTTRHPGEIDPDLPRGLVRVDEDTFMSVAPSEREARVVPTPLQQTVPGWSLFAMFFIVVPLAGSFIRERQEGTLRRLATYPVPRAAIVIGKLFPYLLVNVIQFAAMLAVGCLVVPAVSDLSLHLGVNPHHLVPVTLAAAFAATGFGIFVACVSRTIEQASALGSTSIIIMAVAGGIMVPSFLMPRFMQTIALLSPLYWGQQAYLDVLLRASTFTEIAPKLAALVAFGIVCLTLASWRLRRLR